MTGARVAGRLLAALGSAVDGQPMAVRIVPGATGIAAGFDTPPRQLVLAPGDRAQAALLWRNTVTDATVPAANGRYLAVAPVSGRPAQPVELDGPIDLGTTGRLGASAWRPAERPKPGDQTTGTPPAGPGTSGPPATLTPPPDSRL
ncbi:DUF4232 domain-containing protein [Micromonospora sp. NBC_00898]|uniref:DUF4232 domain-containing protein n=1 Tax=Micromonospora sp. NBC_00898 TaxID=2975981 RepID=UPI00386DE6DF|nr:DUF4232 domain-containing protein [Micromonospora sp. NBC_00898]